MAMTDITFVLIFLPVLLLVIAFKYSLQKYALLLLSLFYYACGSPRYFVLLLEMLVINISLAYFIEKSTNRRKLSFMILTIGILINVGVLFYYKYFDFVIEGTNQVFGTVFTARDLLLPMGISFFSFKAISLLIDVYKGTVVMERNPIYSALYLSFFGQIVSGPICRYNEFYKNTGFNDSTIFSWNSFADGGYLFVKGFIKKVLFANILSLISTEVFSMDLVETSAPLLWLGAICYSLQLFYDFSGYSDMAIGIGNMFGIACPKNFDYPYMTKSISEFWRRWHITLGAWFRDYIYIPLGGSRVDSRIRLYFNLFVVWLLTGIWHGANWTFIFWGFSYFIAISFEKTFHFPDCLRQKWSREIYRILVLGFINFQWVIFNSANLHAGLSYVKHMLIGYGYEVANIRTVVLLKEYGVIIFAAIIFATPISSWLKTTLEFKGKRIAMCTECVMATFMGILFIFALSSVIAGQNNPFLYGNF